MTVASENIYQQYAYSYPHKQAYRTLETPVHIKQVWQQENKTHLFAYMHLPFCEMRCGFCNLFTIANPKTGIAGYLSALEREAFTYREQLPFVRFEEYAIGGGTPTFLEVADFEKVLLIFQNGLGVNLQKQCGSIEASPKSITAEKVQLIEQYGIDRISMGIQSWLKEETKLLGRPQYPKEVHRAVSLLKQSTIPEINLDLIYGIPTQTKTSWLYSLEQTVAYRPTEIFLYPLYTRPLTGLSKMRQAIEDNRLALYRIGSTFLQKNGYKQVSMRCFRKQTHPISKNQYDASLHGMIGIGAGARSYTRQLHYSTHYAVSRKAIKGIIQDYTNRKDFNWIEYGFYLNKEEQLRRFLLKSLIDGSYLCPEKFKRQFHQDLLSLPIVEQLLEKKWLEKSSEGHYQLTALGMEREDQIGSLLFSDEVKSLMQTFELV